MFEAEVLQLLEDLGFTGPIKEPIRTVQEGCQPFDPSMIDTATPSDPFTVRTMVLSRDSFHVSFAPGLAKIASHECVTVSRCAMILRC